MNNDYQEKLMNNLIEDTINRIGKINNPYDACICLLEIFEMNHIAQHVMMVSNKAIELAETFGEDKEKARIAGVLHDVSCIIPNDRRVEVANIFKIKLLNEEMAFPMIIHQRLSREMAFRYFHVTDNLILDAISHHTTLRANASKLDMIIFIADKISWDQPGTPPYLNSIMMGLDKSLECGVYNFIKYLMDNKNNLKVIHPLLVEAYNFYTKRKC